MAAASAFAAVLASGCALQPEVPLTAEQIQRRQQVERDDMQCKNYALARAGTEPQSGTADCQTFGGQTSCTTRANGPSYRLVTQRNMHFRNCLSGKGYTSTWDAWGSHGQMF